ncbi:MAG: hypothetical protein IJS54_06555 [Desulfovibrio sp.]|nr:hypothetical protein [Desulfovibrio sp.]
MPQVAARINLDQERWLKEYFRTKSAGAEFILPWAVDTFFRAISMIKQTFAESELKAIIEAHKDVRLQPENARTSYLLLRISDACEVARVHEKYGAVRTSLDSKIKSLNDTQATALMIWAAAYWVSRKSSQVTDMDEYIGAY